jgi:hypothetical protein
MNQALTLEVEYVSANIKSSDLLSLYIDTYDMMGRVDCALLYN